MEQATGVFEQIFGVLLSEAGIVASVLFLVLVGTVLWMGYWILQERKDHKETRTVLTGEIKELAQATTDALVANAQASTEIKTLLQAALYRSQ